MTTTDHNSLPWAAVIEPVPRSRKKPFRLVFLQGLTAHQGALPELLQRKDLFPSREGFLFVYPHLILEQSLREYDRLPASITLISLRKLWWYFYPGIDLPTFKSNPGSSLLRNLYARLGQKTHPFFHHLPDLVGTLTELPEFHALLALVPYLEELPTIDPGFLERPKVNPEPFQLDQVDPRDLMPTRPTPSPRTNTRSSSSSKNLPQGIVTNFFKEQYLHTRLPNYTYRSQQSDYAETILNTFQDGGHAYLEAPPGTGKTLGYLTAGAHYLERNPHQRILVATATLNLQEQVISQDWPLLQKRFPDLRIAILKGKRNFLCWQALKRAFSVVFDPQETTVHDRAAWIYLALIAHTYSGDIELIPSAILRWLKTLPELLQDTRADIHCYEGSCKYTPCLYQQHLNQALRSQLVILNHFKLPFLPEDIMESSVGAVIDEADRLPDNLRQALTIEIHSRDLKRLLYRLEGSSHRRGFLDILEDSKALDKRQRGVLTIIRRQLSHIRELIQELNDQLKSPEGYSIRETRFQAHPNLSDGSFVALLQNLAKHFSKAGELFSFLGSTKLDPLHGERCDNYAHLLAKTAGELEETSIGYNTPAYVHSYAWEKGAWALKRKPVKIAPLLESLFYDNVPGIVFTSATLTVRKSFSFLTHQLEPHHEEHSWKEHIYPSPFSYTTLAKSFVEASIPNYQFGDQESMATYRQAVNKAIVEYARALRGRTLVLFMSHEELNRSYTIVAPQLEREGIWVFRQEGSSLEAIRRFRQEPETVLMGVDRFWSGVDFPGETLSLVIVVKAPNPAISEPLIAHRRQWEENFMSRWYPLYGAFKLRQGFGRLIRNEKDRGGLVILDSRYLNTNWYPQHITALPIETRFLAQRQTIITELKKLMGR